MTECVEQFIICASDISSVYILDEFFLCVYFLGTLTSSFVPIKPFPNPPVEPPAFEVDEFVPDRASLCDTFDSYINNLYVYPCSLKYEHQKSFPKVSSVHCFHFQDWLRLHYSILQSPNCTLQVNGFNCCKYLYWYLIINISICLQLP